MKTSIKLVIIMLLLLSACCSCVPAVAQKNQQILLDTSGMSPAVKAEITKQLKQNEITDKLDTYSTWAGKGKEIGVAIREGLTAVKDVAIDFSNSKIGETVVWLIVWKVAGIDFARMTVSLLLAIIATWLIAKSYFRIFSPRRPVKKSGFFLWPTIEYENYDVSKAWGSNFNRSIAQFMHFACWVAILGIAALVSFA